MLKWELNCLRCGEKMAFLKNEKIQLGEAGTTLLGGIYSNITAGALEADIYVCPECGKLEFFRPGGKALFRQAREDKAPETGAFGLPLEKKIAVVKCAGCGAVHSAEDRVCPGCGTTQEPQIPQVECPGCGNLHDFDDPKCPFCRRGAE